MSKINGESKRKINNFLLLLWSGWSTKGHLEIKAKSYRNLRRHL